MRPIIIVLVALAITIAGLTAMLVNRLVDQRPAQVAAVQAPVAPATEDVLVAAADIAPGTVLKSGDLRYMPWPRDGIDERLVLRSSAADPIADYAGTIARRPLLAGEPLSAQAVFRRLDGGILSAMLEPGMRAVSVPVTQTSGVGGFLQPNDHVDILLNQDVKASEVDGQTLHGDFQRLATQAVLSDVRVLAVDDRLVKSDPSAPASTSTSRTVTFELTPKDAEVLLTAQKLGEITLSLRSMARADSDEAPASVTGYTTDIEVSRALQAAAGQRLHAGGPVAQVQVNRAGATLTQSFAN
ncbi:MAG TPA: Flp pilus assembly protein CpaB [Candidatus Sulfotelmatobacter sp.]|jgi:pilus assembly protein CpaB|nr:Flp pilus assembly protein CpaB [Candidatus Sulfotelmatobacter sp.]